MATRLAHAEMRLILAKMIWNIDFELEDKDVDWYANLKGYAIWERTPLRVKMTPVSHAA